jgi:hypothetical protein
MFLKFFIPLLICFLMFQNCDKKVGFSNNENGLSLVNSESIATDEDQSNNSPDLGIDLIHENCDNQIQKVASVNLKFPKPNKTCEWGVDGNLSPLNEFFRGRIEQKVNLNLPEGAIICDASFDFAQQDFLYDDHFIFTFNESVIAASYDFRSKLDAGNFGLLQYDWNKLAGMVWDKSKEQIFCPSIPGFQSSCSFPGHDQQGLINLSYDSNYIRGIMSNGIPPNHYFQMISIGDNDNLDCEHSEVTFNVNVKYVIR